MNFPCRFLSAFCGGILALFTITYFYLLMPLESKFVSNCDNRCFHDFFVLTFDQFWFNVESPAQVARRVPDFGAKFQIVEIWILRETEGLLTNQKISLIPECVLQSRQFKCIYILITNFYSLLHLPIIPNFNTFQTQRRSRWDEISRAVKYTQLLQQTIVHQASGGLTPVHSVAFLPFPCRIYVLSAFVSLACSMFLCNISLLFLFRLYCTIVLRHTYISPAFYRYWDCLKLPGPLQLDIGPYIKVRQFDVSSRPGGTFSNQVGTSLFGGYNLPSFLE